MRNRVKDSAKFKRTASGTKAINMPGAVIMRGGTRL